jgi:hypothetical protein
MRQYHAHSVEQEVEWLYAFDVHANAFFCSFLVTYVLQVLRCVFFIFLPFVCLFIASRLLISFLSLILSRMVQYFLLPMLIGRSLFSCLLSNTLYALATVWYAYITHLGYRGRC